MLHKLIPAAGVYCVFITNITPVNAARINPTVPIGTI
jgi:hypothetical protein